MSDNNAQSIQQPNPDEVKHRSILRIQRELNLDAQGDNKIQEYGLSCDKYRRRQTRLPDHIDADIRTIIMQVEFISISSTSRDYSQISRRLPITSSFKVSTYNELPSIADANAQLRVWGVTKA